MRESNYLEMTVEHLGSEATEADLEEFQACCMEAQRLHPELDDDEVTDAVFGQGMWDRNARNLGVDVDRIQREIAVRSSS